MALKESAQLDPLQPTQLDFLDGDQPTSFSGADFVIVGYRPEVRNAAGEPVQDITGNASQSAFIEFANVQTLSISMTRDVAAKRPLGTAWVEEYSRGARTVAGSMAFIMFDQDAFRDLAGARPGSSREDAQFYIPDDIPEFNVVVSATNEFGQTISGILLGVTLVNSGITVGVQDVFTEQMFSYVARRWIPFSGSLELKASLLGILKQYPKIEELIVETYHEDDWQAPRLAPIDEITKRHKERVAKEKAAEQAERAEKVVRQLLGNDEVDDSTPSLPAKVID